MIEEVRTTATSQFTASKTMDPASADPVHGGQVQAQTPTAAQTPTKAPQ